MLPIWKTTKPTLNRTGAGLVDPDTERHHPELGTARQPAQAPGQMAQEAEALFQYLFPSLSSLPSFTSPEFPFLNAHPHPPQPPAGSVALPPLGRLETQNAYMPRPVPPRPYSPTNAYRPADNADAGTEALHRDLVNHRFETLEPHRAMPAGPAGEMMLGRAHAEAMLAFRHQVLSRDLGRDYAQTYRIENGGFAPVHADLIPGNAGDVPLPGGSYPAGTGLVIHSRPVPSAGYPNEADLLRAFHDRTNSLQHPGSRVAMHLLYNPINDRVFMYDGSLDAHGNPHFFQAIVPPPGAQHYAQSAAPHYAQFAPPMPEPVYARPAPPVPPPATGPAARPIEVSDSPIPSPARSPSPDWDNLIDFNP